SLPSRKRGQILIWGALLLGLALIAFSASHWFWLTMPIMVFIGIGQSTRMALSNVLVQAYADDHYRGRVMSIYMMAFRGGMPLGSLAGGYAASLTTAPHVLAVNGALVTVVALYFLVRSHGVREL
nr:MFS transporter [Acidobacteriota bacterium]